MTRDELMAFMKHDGATSYSEIQRGMLPGIRFYRDAEKLETCRWMRAGDIFTPHTTWGASSIDAEDLRLDIEAGWTVPMETV